MSDDLNDCQRAYAILAARPDAADIHNGPTPRIEIRRRIAGRGELSDGTRVFLIQPCELWRWLCVHLGSDTLAEIDQREHFQQPQEIARLVMEAINRAAKTYRTELTPAGEQTVIPGCEIDAAPSVRQLSLF